MTKRGVKIVLTLTFWIFITIFLQQTRAQTETGLTVGYNNVPPFLISQIPDQAWAINTNLTNAFDLDDHFIDNETLTYSANAVQNITILINTTTNTVSFHPDRDFNGIRNVTFTAFDGLTTTESNLVTLNVTADTKPPTWSNPRKNKIDSQIFQNTILTFLADWQDDIELDRFIFAIKQESGWVNQSPISLTGQQNTSSYTQQISAPAGTTVFWRFFGFDTSDNSNATEIKNFTVSEGSATTSPPSTDDDDDETTSSEQITTGSVTQQTIGERTSDFSVGPSESYKLDIKQGATGTITLQVTNIGKEELEFTIELFDFDNFETFISEEQFNLTAGETKSVTIEFHANRRLPPDLYYGIVKLKTSTKEKEIPVVIAIAALNIEFELDLILSEESKERRPGEKVTANITLTNLEDIEKRNVTLNYAIKSFRDETIDTATEELTFDARSITLAKELILPDQIQRGEYIFFARAASGNEIALDSKVFQVQEAFSVAAFLKANIFFVGIIAASLFITLLMVREHKSKERMRLLNLYLLITELNKLVKENRYDEAVGIYIRIKAAYGEPVSQTALSNKEQLKKEMSQLAGDLDTRVLQKIKTQIKQSEKTSEEEVKNKSEKQKDAPQQEKDQKQTDNKEGTVEDKQEENSQEQKEEAPNPKEETKPAEEEKSPEEPKEKIEQNKEEIKKASDESHQEKAQAKTPKAPAPAKKAKTTSKKSRDKKPTKKKKRSKK